MSAASCRQRIDEKVVVCGWTSALSWDEKNTPRRTSPWFLNRLTYVRTEVNYTEEVDDPVDSDGEQNRLRPASWVASNSSPLVSNFPLMPCTAGEVLGFENLVFSIFDFVHTLLENNKFKSTVKKALPELIYYVILYMQITEEQVRTRSRPRQLRLAPPASACAHSTTRIDCLPNAPSDQSMDGEPSAVCGGRGRWHFLVLGQDFCSGSADGEIPTHNSLSGPGLSNECTKIISCKMKWSCICIKFKQFKFRRLFDLDVHISCEQFQPIQLILFL